MQIIEGGTFPLEYANCRHIWKEIDQLRKSVKPYVGIMPQSTFSNTIRAIIAGTCKRKTESLFLSKFGIQSKYIF